MHNNLPGVIPTKMNFSKCSFAVLYFLKWFQQLFREFIRCWVRSQQLVPQWHIKNYEASCMKYCNKLIPLKYHSHCSVVDFQNRFYNCCKAYGSFILFLKKKRCTVSLIQLEPRVKVERRTRKYSGNTNCEWFHSFSEFLQTFTSVSIAQYRYMYWETRENVFYFSATFFC